MASSVQAINKILETKPTITGRSFVYLMPKWAAVTLKGVIFLFGIATFYLAFHEQGTTPAFITGILYILSACFLLAAIHPKTGREKIYFICDNLGMYFPSYQSQMLFPHGHTEVWLFVPWKNITDIKTAKLRGDEGSVKGLSFSVKATEEEEKLFFGNLATVKRQCLGNVDAAGNLIVGYSNFFQSPKRVVSILRQFAEGIIHVQGSQRTVS